MKNVSKSIYNATIDLSPHDTALHCTPHLVRFRSMDLVRFRSMVTCGLTDGLDEHAVILSCHVCSISAKNWEIWILHEFWSI